MSTLRDDVVDLIGAQIKEALSKEFNRGWEAAMKYHWNNEEHKEKEPEKKT